MAESGSRSAEPEADWAPAAARDVDQIWDYYAEAAAPDTADRMIATIFSSVERITAHPFQGRSRADIRDGLRSVRAAPYIVFYRFEPGRVQIVRVLHERRDIEVALADLEP